MTTLRLSKTRQEIKMRMCKLGIEIAFEAKADFLDKRANGKAKFGGLGNDCEATGPVSLLESSRNLANGSTEPVSLWESKRKLSDGLVEPISLWESKRKLAHGSAQPVSLWESKRNVTSGSARPVSLWESKRNNACGSAGPVSLLERERNLAALSVRQSLMKFDFSDSDSDDEHSSQKGACHMPQIKVKYKY